MEDDRRILADPKSIKDRYLSEMNRFLEQFKQACFENQIDYCLIDSSTPLDQALIQFLAREKVPHTHSTNPDTESFSFKPTQISSKIMT